MAAIGCYSALHHSCRVGVASPAMLFAERIGADLNETLSVRPARTIACDALHAVARLLGEDFAAKSNWNKKSRCS